MSDTKQLGAGPAQGLDRLYRNYAAWLHRRLRSYITADEAADVVQETYIRLAPYQSDTIRHPKALLIRIALNLVRDEKRKAARRTAFAAQSDPVESVGGGQLEALVLKEAILDMPAIFQEVFVMNRFGGMTYPQIAEALDLSVKAVEWRMSKALDHCASRLEA